MSSLKKIITEPIPGTRFMLWHVLAGLSLLWIVPAFLPWSWGAMNGPLSLIFLTGWYIAYNFINYLMKHTLRASTTDILLIERIFILMSFLVPALQGFLYGIANGFSTFIITINGVLWVICLLLVIGVIIHIKKAGSYYHGVKKVDIFQ